MNKGTIYTIDHLWIAKLLAWADQHFPYVAYFSPQAVPYPFGGFEQLFFAGYEACSFEQLEDLPPASEKIGLLAYDLKNQFEQLSSHNPPLLDTPDSVFFTPYLKIKISSDVVEIFHPVPQEFFSQINAFHHPVEDMASKIAITPLTSREEYLQTAERIKDHIIEGDIYEMNYCIAFQASFQRLNPIRIYLDLMKKSPMPFSAFFKAQHQYLIGASPERFIKKSGSLLIAQPIKGTIRRGISAEEDQALQSQLKNSEKERAENLMIVDLMRNDLSRVAETGTVKVEELFGIYPFKRVSQMISTVSATLRREIGFKEIVESTFPMGSMTGAPKIRCMELIEQYENFKRGWFSGSLGYIAPNGDFDFNVVIRSMVLDVSVGKLFFAVGSAITFDADPIQEYEECLLKAQPILDMLAFHSQQKG